MKGESLETGKEREDLSDALRWAIEVALPYIVDSAATQVVYLVLVWHAYSQGWDCVRIATADLEKKTGLARNTIRACVKRLEALGLVVRLGYSTRSAETYRVLLPCDVQGPWGATKPTTPLGSIKSSDVGRNLSDPISRLSEEGRRAVIALRDSLPPNEKAAIRARAVRLAKDRASGAACSIEDADLAEMEILLMERFGPERLREFGVIR